MAKVPRSLRSRPASLPDCPTRLQKGNEAQVSEHPCRGWETKTLTSWVLDKENSGARGHETQMVGTQLLSRIA